MYRAPEKKDIGGKKTSSQDFGGERGSSQDVGGKKTSSQDVGGRKSSSQDFGGERMASQDFGGKKSSSTDYGGEKSSSQDVGGKKGSSQDFGGERMASQDFGGKKSSSQDFSGKQGSSQDVGGKKTSSQDVGGKKSSSQDFGGERMASQDFGGKKGSSQDFGGKKSSSLDFGSKKGSSQDFGGEKSSSLDERSSRLQLSRNSTSMSVFRSSDSIEREPFEELIARFETLSEVRNAIQDEGVRDCGLIIGIDYTLSNNIQGQTTFNGKSLHNIEDTSINPYQEVICILGECLESMNDRATIPIYGFGDFKVKDKGIFPLKLGEGCEGFADVLEAYNEVTPTVKLGGPTNFAPLIEEAIKIVVKRKQYHILAIVADGQVTSEAETVDAIVEASHHALSIIVIGVGDGPWETMVDFVNQLPERKFDNVQFVDFHKIKNENKNPHAAIALVALKGIPDQYREIKEQSLLKT